MEQYWHRDPLTGKYVRVTSVTCFCSLIPRHSDLFNACEQRAVHVYSVESPDDNNVVVKVVTFPPSSFPLQFCGMSMVTVKTMQ